MRIKELREAIAANERKLLKIERKVSEKKQIESELETLRAELKLQLDEQEHFINALDENGITIAEAGELLGISKKVSTGDKTDGGQEE
jgi:hypothetical protein